jgi:hypothetical protein
MAQILGVMTRLEVVCKWRNRLRISIKVMLLPGIVPPDRQQTDAVGRIANIGREASRLCTIAGDLAAVYYCGSSATSVKAKCQEF